jgi:hypothetical protein
MYLERSSLDKLKVKHNEDIFVAHINHLDR